MKGYRFYLKFPLSATKEDRRKLRNHSGTVVALPVPTELPRFRSTLSPVVIGGFTGDPDSEIQYYGVLPNFLHDECRRISECKARKIHPKLFEYLDEKG